MSSEAINEHVWREISKFQSRCSVNITEKDRMDKKKLKTLDLHTIYIIYIYVFCCLTYRLTDTKN